MDAATHFLHQLASASLRTDSPSEQPAAAATLAPAQLGATFATAMYLVTTSQALVEKRWLVTRGSAAFQRDFAAFVAVAMQRELRPLYFLAELLTDPTDGVLARIAMAVLGLTRQIVSSVAEFPRASFAEFATATVARMAALSRFEETLQPQRLVPDVLLPNVLYRAFDLVDQVLQLDYHADDAMVRNATTERLYEGSGHAVQTSYATILLVLDTLALPERAHVVDLGSGFGRLGLVAGLWRTDLTFTGYEYVGHRVDIAAASAQRAGLSARVRFLHQDLADPAFEMPAADAYYMYDPFCDETYRRVLARLLIIGRTRAISVVTKGNAGAWLAQAAAEAGWPSPQPHDLGNLLLFRSRA